MKTYQKVVIGIGAALVVLVAAVIFIFSWEGSPKKIVAIADQFQVPASWELTSEDIRPPRLVCWDGGGCPLVHKVWKTDGMITRENFEQMLQVSNWNFTVDKDCKLPGNVSGSAVSACSAEGAVDEYDVKLWLSIDSALPDQQEFVLSVRPIR